MTVRDIDHGYDDLEDLLNKLNASITVGIHGEDSETYVRGQSEPVTVAQVATFHEFGAPKAGIPERSFIRSTIDENQDEYADQIETTIKFAINALGSGQIDDVIETELKLTGQQISDDIKAKIVDIDSPPPSDPDNDNLLIETAQMKNSIGYKVHI